MFNKELLLPALIGLGLYAQNSETNLCNNTTLIIIIVFLLMGGECGLGGLFGRGECHEEAELLRGIKRAERRLEQFFVQGLERGLENCLFLTGFGSGPGPFTRPTPFGNFNSCGPCCC